MPALAVADFRPDSPLPGFPFEYDAQEPGLSDLRYGVEIATGGEQRVCSRRSLRCPIHMIPIPGEQPPHTSDAMVGDCLNISDGGLYGTMPIGYGMAVGQQYVFRLRTRELGPDGPQVILRQGVVVRTELLLCPSGDQVGIGVRFCGHRSGVLATPASA